MTPREWEDEKDLDQIVFDPDGWRFKHTQGGVTLLPRSFQEPIYWHEYELRRLWSTIGPRRQ